jgi:hypothetical protein
VHLGFNNLLANIYVLGEKPMRIPAFKTTQFNDHPHSALQNSTSEMFRSLQRNPFLVGMLLTEMIDTDSSSSTYNKKIPIKLGLGNVKIPHNLPQAPEGYLVVFQDRPSSIYQVIPPQPQNQKEEQAQKREAAQFITFNASAEVVVKIWVF